MTSGVMAGWRASTSVVEPESVVRRLLRGAWCVEGAVAEHGEEHADAVAAAGEAEEGLRAGFPACPACVVIGAGEGVGSGRAARRRRETWPVELPVSASGRVFAVDRGAGLGIGVVRVHPRYADLPPASCPASRRTGWCRTSHRRLRRHLPSPVTPPGHAFDRGTQSCRARGSVALLQDHERHNGRNSGLAASRWTVYGHELSMSRTLRRAKDGVRGLPGSGRLGLGGLRQAGA